MKAVCKLSQQLARSSQTETDSNDLIDAIAGIATPSYLSKTHTNTNSNNIKYTGTTIANLKIEIPKITIISPPIQPAPPPPPQLASSNLLGLPVMKGVHVMSDACAMSNLGCNSIKTSDYISCHDPILPDECDDDGYGYHVKIDRRDCDSDSERIMDDSKEIPLTPKDGALNNLSDFEWTNTFNNLPLDVKKNEEDKNMKTIEHRGRVKITKYSKENEDSVIETDISDSDYFDDSSENEDSVIDSSLVGNDECDNNNNNNQDDEYYAQSVESLVKQGGQISDASDSESDNESEIVLRRQGKGCKIRYDYRYGFDDGNVNINDTDNIYSD